MNDFPDFMKNPANRIARTDQATLRVEGYVFEGLDGSQMSFWICYRFWPDLTRSEREQISATDVAAVEGNGTRLRIVAPAAHDRGAPTPGPPAAPAREAHVFDSFA